MTNQKQRLTLLERARSKADIKAMSDVELDAHIRTLGFGTPECYAAIVARVVRHPSVFPVAHGEPDYPVQEVGKRQSKLNAHTPH